MGAFGLLGLTLAVIGIYGVMAQLVAVRVPEIGVRMTLGARPADILRQLLGEGCLAGGGRRHVGLIAGGFLMTLAETLLFSIKPWDPITLAGVSLARCIAAALAACLVPARRAMKVDPVDALRQKLAPAAARRTTDKPLRVTDKTSSWPALQPSPALSAPEPPHRPP